MAYGQIPIGKCINIARVRRGMTLHELSKKAHISLHTLESWFYHNHTPTIELLCHVADALELSIDEVIGRRRIEDREATENTEKRRGKCQVTGKQMTALADLIAQAEGLVNNDVPTPEQMAVYLLEHGVILTE